MILFTAKLVSFRFTRVPLKKNASLEARRLPSEILFRRFFTNLSCAFPWTSLSSLPILVDTFSRQNTRRRSPARFKKAGERRRRIRRGIKWLGEAWLILDSKTWRAKEEEESAKEEHRRRKKDCKTSSSPTVSVLLRLIFESEPSCPRKILHRGQIYPFPRIFQRTGRPPPSNASVLPLGLGHNRRCTLVT